MSRSNRREFLKRAAAGGVAAAAFAVAGAKASGRILGANDRIRIAVVGVNGRGTSHLQAYCDMNKNVEVAYIVDIDRRLFGPRSKWVHDRAGNTPQCVQDLRKALEDKDLDAVSIATTNHTHALLAIWACQAGKDVYVEKPCSHNIYEGRKLVEAARKYDRIVQHGTQNRGDANWIKQVAAVRGGKYGKLRIVYGSASKPRPSIGFADPKEPPKELDFDQWLGPAPVQPYRKNLVPYNWHWFWDFGNGEIGNQGVHQMDVARWVMPDGAAPKTVVSLGGRYGYKDQGQTPNTQLTVIDFGEAKIIFEDRGLVDSKGTRLISTNEFLLEGGAIRGGKFFATGNSRGEPIEDAPADFPGSQPIFENFIDCVRSRKRENLRAEIFEGHLSATLCHLGNVSYRLGTDVSFGQATKAFGDDQAAGESFESMKRYLADAAKLKLEDSTYRLGRKLTYDAKAERFVGDEEANGLLSRPYRKPYVVPDSV